MIFEDILNRLENINFFNETMRNSPQAVLFWFNKDMTKII